FLDWFRGVAASDPLAYSPELERRAQFKTVWSLFLYKADASYSFQSHNGKEASIATKFAGIASPDLSAADSSSLAFDYSVRLQRDSKRAAIYLQSDFNYSFKKQRNKDGSYARSESADYWYHESGLAVRLSPAHQNPTGWKLLIPGSLRTQLPPL